VHADLPAQDTAVSKRDSAVATAPSAIATGPSAIPATPSPAAVAAAFTDGPFEHGTDAEMIERRVRTANPLVTPSPGRVPHQRCAATCSMRFEPATGRPRPGRRPRRASRTGVLQQLRTLETAGW